METNIDTKDIWRRMHERLLAYIRRRVSTGEDAEDILQDVFVRIHTNLHRLKETQNLRAWIYQITRNAIADYYRRRARASEIVQELTPDVGEASLSSPSGQTPGTPADAVDTELNGCMEPLLGELPEPYRRAVTMTEMDGLTQTEAARELGLSVSGMKSRVQRGRRKLKELLLDCCQVELDRRRGVVDFEPRDGGACGECNSCG